MKDGAIALLGHSFGGSLEGAVHLANAPMCFLQPSDGESLEPTRVLSSAAIRDGLESQAGIFPAATGDTFSEIQSNFVSLDGEVANWGPSVVAFLHLHFVK